MKRMQWGVLLIFSFTILFKGVARHDWVASIVNAVEQSEQVKPFSLRRAQRGWLLYEGESMGDPAPLIGLLEKLSTDRMLMQTVTKEDGVELVFTPDPEGENPQ